MSTNHRIDVHQHVLPPFWVKALPTHGGDPSGPRSGDPSSTVLPQWSPECAIDLMDSQEIAIGILSLTAPGIVGWDKSERREMARPSPLLANLFLHYALDRWLAADHPQVPFERYADDVIAHCRTEKEAQEMRKPLDSDLASLRDQFANIKRNRAKRFALASC